jgi:rubrerythrin
VQPSLKSVDRVVAWELKGVVAVKGRPDATSRTIEVQVSLPSQVPLVQQPATVTCEYCGTVYPETLVKCPNCGAPRKK